MAPREWWIDGSIGRDTGGYLYVTWDSQRHGHEVAWLSFSANGGAKWSPPVQVSRDRANVPHIAAVAGGFRRPTAQAAVGDPIHRGQLPRLRLTFPAPVRWWCRGPASRGRAGGA